MLSSQTERGKVHLMQFLVVFLLFLFVLVVWLYLIEPITEKRKLYGEKILNASKSVSFVQKIQDRLMQQEDFTNKVILSLRHRQEAGENCRTAIQYVIAEFGDKMTEDSALQFVARAGYQAIDLATVMAGWNYSPDNVEERLRDDYQLEISDRIKILAQVFPKDSIEATLGMLVSAFSENENEKLIPAFLGIFSSPVLVGEAFYKNTNLRLAPIVTKLGLRKDPDAIAEIARKAKIDLMDADEYSEFRSEEGFDFDPDMAVILAKFGISAEKILETENEYDTFDFDDGGHRESVFKALRPCGFNDKDILCAMNSLYDVSVAKVVVTGIENGVSPADIADFLRPDWENNLGGLWDEFNEEGNISTENSVEILYALIPSEKRGFGRKKDAELEKTK